MHVVFFNRSYYPDNAATGQLLAELCESLAGEHGCQVSVVAGGFALNPDIHGGEVVRNSPLIKWERYRGVNILRGQGTQYSKQSLLGRGVNYVTYFSSACVAGQRVGKPDVVVALTDPPIIGLAAYMCARRFGVPFVMAYQDIFPEVAQVLNGIRSQTINSTLGVVNRFLAARADYIVALGETMRQRLISHKGADPARTTVISNWADCSLIEPAPKQNTFAEEHDLTDKFVVMHSGNIGMSQGLELLVDAAAQLTEYPDIQFLIIGDGVNKPALEARARSLGLNNIKFLPLQPKSRLRESLGTADVSIISLKEGLAGYIVPSKLYGILAAGRPYIAAVEPDCEISSLTQRFQCGLLVQPGDSADLARKILSLYRDAGARVRMGENARKAALEFDRPVQVRAYYDLLSGLVREARHDSAA